MRDHHPIPYLRECAAALIKIAGGVSPRAVAHHGLLKSRKTDTVYAWLNAYQQYGLGGLYEKPRRRRTFSSEQIADLREILHQTPANFGLRLTRWTLKAIRKACIWLKNYTLSGIWRILRALHIQYKRGQQHIHSPDSHYVSKRDRAAACLREAKEHPGEIVTHYLDEFSYYRWPTVANVYYEAGKEQPKAKLVPRYNTRGRIIAALNVADGKVLYRQYAHITVQRLVSFMETIRSAFPQAVEIYVIQDNWRNVHFHPDQVAAAQRLGITLVPLPIYAPWLNYIEKLGRKMKQEILHMHQQGDDWLCLKERVRDFLDQFADGSIDLLKYVGLLPD